jgi:hypothetical protein
MRARPRVPDTGTTSPPPGHHSGELAARRTLNAPCSCDRPIRVEKQMKRMKEADEGIRTLDLRHGNPIHVVLLIALLAFWVIPAVLTAQLAGRKGRSFAVYLVASLVIGWLIPLIGALVVPDNRGRSA